ncbi:MAG: 4-hydroxy-3-methylbut-2-enyl diphosphate reductase [Deltaproteobacteria bacterium]|nr:4-hydroxy-3-methylbut-2-enyl diphosphate reductase [Deltaproteobacteria bacterium]
MKIRKAIHAGYCWGVERALDIVTDTAAAHPGETVRTLGPIIHNPHVVQSLEEKGVQSVNDLDEMGSGTVIIRTHGVPPETYEHAKAKGLNVVDATCPLVTLVQNKAKQLVQEGYHLVIFGNPRHPEVIGTIGHAGGKATVIEHPEDVEKVHLPKRVGVVVQTTQETELLAALLAHLAPRCKEVKIFNTICNPTIERQEAARELARDVQVVIVVGGKNSSNTRHLAEVCREEGATAYHIEDATELDPQWVKGIENIGITAGASTPGWLMDQVVERLEKIEPAV